MDIDSPDLVIAKRLLDHLKLLGFQFRRVAPGDPHPLGDRTVAVRNDACVDHDDEFLPEPADLFSDGGGRINTEDGYAIIVRVDRTTRLTTLDVEDSEGSLIDSRVLDVEDLQRLHDALTAAWEHSRTSDVPVVLDVSAVIGRD